MSITEEIEENGVVVGSADVQADGIVFAVHDPIDIAAETMGADLMELVLLELKTQTKPWVEHNEAEQESVIERVRKRVEQAVRDAVGLIAAEGLIKVVADIEGVTIKDKIKALVTISKSNDQETLHSLFGAAGQSCLILISGAEQFTGGMGAIQPDKDQKELPIFDEATGEVVEPEKNGDDPLYAQAIKFVITEQKASISSVQRHLRVGYNRAARMIEMMQSESIISTPDERGNRTVLVAE